MKKILLFSIFALITGIGVQQYAHAASVMEPQWAEFCLPLYENAVFKKADDNSKRYAENNYWALRRVKFEKSVLECKVYSKTDAELSACFSRVANIERNKTNQRNLAKDEKYEKQRHEINDSGNGYGYGYHYWWY